jgi:hypothetical protein
LPYHCCRSAVDYNIAADTMAARYIGIAADYSVDNPADIDNSETVDYYIDNPVIADYYIDNPEAAVDYSSDSVVDTDSDFHYSARCRIHSYCYHPWRFLLLNIV